MGRPHITDAEALCRDALVREHEYRAQKAEYEAEAARLTLDSVRREHAKLYGASARLS